MDYDREEALRQILKNKRKSIEHNLGRKLNDLEMALLDVGFWYGADAVFDELQKQIA